MVNHQKKLLLYQAKLLMLLYNYSKFLLPRDDNNKNLILKDLSPSTVIVFLLKKLIFLLIDIDLATYNLFI